MTSKSLDGKVALVTGVSSGIGQAISRALGEAGATVFGISRSASGVPANVQHIPADLTVPDEIESAFAELSHLDILVNNAGIAFTSRISDGDPTEWEHMWRLNVHAPALVCQRALPLLGRGAHVVNISSQSGHRVPPSGGFYAPTKFALRGITDALRAELASDPRAIRVASISPGYVDTAILDHYFKGREDKLAETKANTRMLEPEDVADTVLHIVTAPKHVAFDDIRLRSCEQIG